VVLDPKYGVTVATLRKEIASAEKEGSYYNQESIRLMKKALAGKLAGIAASSIHP